MGKIRDLGKKTNSALAIFTVLCGFVVMWASSLGGSTTQNSLQKALQGAVEIDAARPSPSNNGKLVVVAGKLRGEPLLEDELLLPQPVVRLRRNVEMFQWVEHIKDEGAPVYSMEWAPREIDFFKFRQPTGHENPVMKVRPLEIKAAMVFFGAFDGARTLDAIATSFPLKLTPEMLKDPARIIEKDKIVIKRDPSTKDVALGDMRVWYEVVPSDYYTLITQQIDEMSLVGSRPTGNFFIQRGRYSADELFESLSEGATAAYNGMLFLGALVMSFGLISALRPYADRIDLNPKVDIKGMPAVLLISFGISGALMGIFMVLALLDSTKSLF